MVHSNCVSGSSPVLRNRPKMYPWKWRSQPIENQMTNARSLQEAPPEAPRSPHNDSTVRGPDVHPAKREESLIFLRFLKDFGICFFSAFRRLKTAQEAPKIAHEASKMAP